MLFGEAQSRIVLSSRPEKFARIQGIAESLNCRLTKLGVVTDGPLTIQVDGQKTVDLSVSSLRSPYEGAIPGYMN